MFTSKQIVSATRLVKNFRHFAQKLRREPQALLILQKGSESLVLVNADIFEDLMACREQALRAGFTFFMEGDQEYDDRDDFSFPVS